MQACRSLAALLLVCGASSERGWSYLRETEWAGACSAGSRQSPINVETGRTESIDQNTLLFEGYRNVIVRGVNTGRMVQFIVEENQTTPTLSGGPLHHAYFLERVDVHWMAEHAIDYYKHPLELQFVHTRIDVLPAADVAYNTDSIAIVAVHYEISIVTHKEAESRTVALPIDRMMKLMEGLKKENYTVHEELDLMELLGNYESYFTYNGSQTTPDCQEVVTWIILDTAMHMTDHQYKQLSSIDIGGAMNFRTVQPINSRTVYRTACKGPICIDDLELKLNSGYRSAATLKEYVLLAFAAIVKVLLEMTATTLL